MKSSPYFVIMIVIKVELWPFGSESNKRTLATMYIANDGTGTNRRGNYSALIGRKKYPSIVKNYPRLSYPVWELLRRVLNAKKEYDSRRNPKD